MQFVSILGFYEQLTREYEADGKYPAGQIRELAEDENYSGTGVAVRSTPGEEYGCLIYLPDTVLTEEEWLEIIEYLHKLDYSLRETTMTLVPQVVDAVDIPVIAAGGIGDGRGVCAAFMLGAEAVQMGTRFVVAKESNVHQNYKDRVIAAKDIDSVVTGRSTGHPVRSLRNSMTREYLDMEKEGVEFEKLERLTLGTLRKAVVDGDVKQGTVMAGQIAGLVNKEQTCEEIIKELMKEVSEVYNSHNKLA